MNKTSQNKKPGQSLVNFMKVYQKAIIIYDLNGLR